MQLLPASCTVQLKQKLDHAASWTSVATVSTTNNIDDAEAFSGDGLVDSKILQLRLDLGISVNTTPQIEELGCVFIVNDYE